MRIMQNFFIIFVAETPAEINCSQVQ